MDFFLRIAKVLKTPTKYFSTVKKEGLKEPVVFYLIFTAVVGLLSAASQIKTFQISAGWYPLMYVAIVLFGMVGAFIGAGITHVFVMLFKGKGTYIDTFKARAYGSVPSLLWAIPMVAMILVISSEIVVLLVSILSIFPAIYSIYLEVVGLSTLHKISKGKAFGAIILPIIIIFVLALGFFFFVMMAALAGGM